jgi:hypothetical protein
VHSALASHARRASPRASFTKTRSAPRHPTRGRRAGYAGRPPGRRMRNACGDRPPMRPPGPRSPPGPARRMKRTAGRGLKLRCVKTVEPDRHTQAGQDVEEREDDQVRSARSIPSQNHRVAPGRRSAREVEAEAKRVTATVGCCWRCRLPPSRLDRCGVRLAVDPGPRRSGQPRPAEPATGRCARPSPSRALPCFRGDDASPPSCLPRNLPTIASPDSADYPVKSMRTKARLSRPSKAALVPARQGWSFACSATLRWLSSACPPADIHLDAARLRVREPLLHDGVEREGGARRLLREREQPRSRSRLPQGCAASSR